MKNSIINRIATVLLCGVSLLAATTGWSVPKTVERWAKVVYLNPITGEASPAAGAGLVPMWGFAATALGDATVPGPQIDVDLSQNDGLAITVHNALPEPISVVIPNIGSSADMGQPVKFTEGAYIGRVRSFVPEVAPLPSTATHTYTWTNLKPGTFVYHSGSHPALQVQMGLFGMVTVKVAPGTAYPAVAIGLGGEVPVILSEIDPVLHQAVADGKYGPLFQRNADGSPVLDAGGNPVPTGNTTGSTIRSVPKFFLINGRAYDPVGAIDPTPLLTPAMKNGWTTLFRVINVGWNSHIPSLTGPFPSGSANYLKVIAEDGEPYPFPKTLYAPSMSAMKTMDIQFTPPADAATREYQVSDRKLGLANGGGMFRKLNAEPAAPCTPAAIATAPVITTPTPVYIGDTVTLSAAAASGTAPLIYQWRQGGVPLSNGGYIAGVNSATLTLTSVPLAASGSYDVVVANGCGSAVSPSTPLTVNCKATTITGPTPASQTLNSGATAIFSVTATGSAPLSYQWRKHGVPIVGATSSTLTLTGITTDSAGSYDVLVTNPCGNSTQSGSATLTICAPAAITGQPASQAVGYGATAIFTVTATGTAPLTYQWRKGGVNIPGAITNPLALNAVTFANAGSYDVVVGNNCGSSTSLTATLTVTPGFTRSVVTNRSNGAGVNTLTTPPILIGGTGKLLVVAVLYRDTATAPAPSILSVTNLSAAGQTFTRLATGNWGPNGNVQGKLDLWYRVAPADGNATVRVNFAGTTTMEQIAIVADLFNGVNQTTPFGTAVTDYSTANRGTLTLNPASTTSDLVINWTGYNSVLNTVTDGVGQTSRGIATNPFLLTTVQSASVRVSSKSGASPNTAMSETFTISSTVSMGAVAIKP